MDPIMFGAGIFAFVMAVSVVALVTRGPEAPSHCRVVGTVFLLAVAAFCVFGFLATFDPADFVVIRIVYGVVGSGSLLGAGCLVASKTRSAVTIS
jgi:hypothetical protein